MTSLKTTAAAGIKWTAVSNVGRRLISVGANILLARLLTPEDFGLIAMAALVTGFLDLFRDLGTGSAIVQRSEIDEVLLSSIFWVNVGFGLLVTLVLAVGAPLVGWLYHEPRVIPLLQVMAASFFLAALGIVQNGLMMRELRFDDLAKLELVAALLAAGTGVALALLGWGVWSLVVQVVTGSAVGTALFWLARRWRPRLTFDGGRLRDVMGYSLNLTASNVLNFASRNVDNLLIGRFLGAEALGYYDLAYRLMLYPLQSISAVIGRVMFPLLSRMQKDIERFRFIYVQVVTTIALVSFPIMFGLLALRAPFIHFLVGDKWEPVITLLLFFAPLGAIQSILTTVGIIYLAMGRTRLMLGWMTTLFVVVMIAFAIGLQWGIVGVAVAYTLAYAILMYPGFAIPYRLIGLPVADLVRALWRPLVASLVMAAVLMLLDSVLPPNMGAAVRLLVSLPIGAACYATMIWFTFRAQAIYVWQTLRGR